MKYSDIDIAKVKSSGDIRDFIPGAQNSRATCYVRCPECGTEGKGKGLSVVHKAGKDFAHCFHCGFSLSGAVAACMYYDFNNDKKKYPEAIKRVAERSGVVLLSDDEKLTKEVSRQKKLQAKSFCERQLEGSGLTVEDVMVKVKQPNGGYTLEPAFRKGSLDFYGNIRPGDDEMLIYYYRLDGTMEMYATRGARGALRPYIRIRYSNPELHTPKDAKRSCKYLTPKGAPTKFYFPQRIRDAYNEERHIETLVIQEGEKKAEKACKHGVMSIGIQGIYNIGNKESGLPADLQYIVQRCGVRNVVLLMDSDWCDLSKNLRPDEPVDFRPRQFAGAAKKFKKYVNSLHNQNINVDVYFGHINENDRGDKGVDDLLCGLLKGKEDELARDIDFALHAHDGIGKYCSIHNISTLSDLKIEDFWLLNDRDAFFEKYFKLLEPLKIFKFDRFRYKVDDGKVILASKYTTDANFWSVTTNENSGKKNISLDTFEALKFVNEAGYYRIRTADMERGRYGFVRIEDGVVHQSDSVEIRDFVWNYILQSTKDKDIRNHFSARLTSDLGDDKLERLDKLEDEIEVFTPFLQNLYFKNGMLSVTPNGIEWSSAILGHVWEAHVLGHRFSRVKIIDKIEYSPENGFEIYMTADGEKCEILKFLCCTSNFWWKKTDLTPLEQQEFSQHLVNKITALGYLICDYKFLTELKAVIAMDGELSDVGQSNGRTGKSLIGDILLHIKGRDSRARVDGRNTKNDDDFVFSDVTLMSRVVFIDDVNVNFNFERFYNAVTGDLTVNPKGRSRFTIPRGKSPKFYITTNHAINGSQSRSSQERIVYMGFSNYFGGKTTPIEEFGHVLFSDWDDEQWNLFFNLMAECVYYYFVSMQSGWAQPGQGCVLPPMHDIMLRTLRQQMSESIYQWAEVYFDSTSNHINLKVPRGEMFEDFKRHFPDARSGISQANFKTKLCFYCQFKGFHFNPNKLNKEGKSFRHWYNDHQGESFIGTADKSGGVEYFSIYDTEHALREPF